MFAISSLSAKKLIKSIMLNFFKRNKVSFPAHYRDLIDEKEYARFLKKCLTVLKQANVNVVSSDNGDITYMDNEGEEGHYFLDNLLRKYIQAAVEDKDTAIENHFNQLRDRSDAYNYFFKDFEYARQFLRVLVRPGDIAPNVADFVSRMDYPNLVTFLVFDFEEQFHYIARDKAEEWQKSEEELFAIAMDNTANEEIEIGEYTFGKKFPGYILFSADFSASYTLLMEQKLDFAVGQYGSLIAIPTKGTAFLHPIETNDVMDLVVILYPEIERFYNEDPGGLVIDFYWYYQGKYYVFDKTYNDDKTVTIKLPAQLDALFNKM